MNTSPQPYPWRLFWVLLAAEVLAALAILPIARDMLGTMAAKLERPAVPLPILIALGVVQNLALLAITLWLGLKLSRALGLRIPLVEHWVEGKPTPNGLVTPILTSGLLFGFVTGIILLVGLLVLVPRVPNLPFVLAGRVSIWKRLLACVYGGVYEELFTRLFLMSVIAWIANRTWRKPRPQLSNAAFWFANIFTAILFGLGHLPSTSLFLPITALVVVAAILLNGIAGIAFGYLFRTRGLEAAIIAHFTADFVIYVVGAGLVKS